MGFDSNGNWTSDFYPETDRDNSIPILASKFQKLIQTDIKSAFDNCLTRDGAGKPESNLNFNGHKITNLADGELAQDSITVRQVQKGQVNYAADTSISANSIVIQIAPSITAYTVGQRFYFKVANTNTLSEVSFIANGLNPCRIQMDGLDNIVAGSLKQNCIYEGVYYETGNTAEATYAGRRIQVLSSASDLASTLNHTQVTNCILAAPNGVATQAGLVITLKSAVRFLMYHGTNADGSIDNVDYTTSADTTYTFAGTEADGTYYLFVDDSGVITPSLSFHRQTDKAIFAECVIQSGAISNFSAYKALELLKKTDIDEIKSSFVFKNTNVVIAQGGPEIVGSYSLSSYLNDGKEHPCLFRVSLVLSANGNAGVALSSDILQNAAVVCGTNNGFATGGSVVIPCKSSVYISMPTSAGFPNATITFLGYW